METTQQIRVVNIPATRTADGRQAASLPIVNKPERTAMVRELTPAQKRAVEFAQQQILHARQAKREQGMKQAQTRAMQEGGAKTASCHRAAISGKENVIGAVSFRHVLGDVLRSLRTKDHKTLREVSQKAGVSLGYLSEVERGQKEASSELLSSISCALGMRMSDTLRLVADEIEKIEDSRQ